MSTTTKITTSRGVWKPTTKTLASLAATYQPSQASDHADAIPTPGPGPHIRPYNPSTDRPGIEAVFREIYTPLYHFSGLTTIAFIIFCRAYLDFSPETCFVLCDPSSGDNKILGYIVGTPSSADFCAQFAVDTSDCRADIEATPAAPRVEEMRDPELRGRCMEYFRQRNAWVAAVGSGIPGIEEIVFSSSKALLAEQHPAHFHIAVLPEAQRCGFGRLLIDSFRRQIQGMGVRGCFAAVPAGDEGTLNFYMRSGFEALQKEESKELGDLEAGPHRAVQLMVATASPAKYGGSGRRGRFYAKGMRY